jgi:DNA-binding NtrC family response regulator
MPDKSAILIVDDEAVILLSIKQELKSRFGDQYLLETALSAEEATVAIDGLVADGIEVILIISDWLMPGMKGDVFLASVKARHPAVRCIIVSGHADPTAIERARETVALDAVISKPWDRMTLLNAVSACLQNVN